MPSRKLHERFDDLLKEAGYISEDADGTEVHDMMDAGSQMYGPRHRRLDDLHDPEMVRAALRGMADAGSLLQETATDELRIAYGHVVLDEIYSEYDDGSVQEEELLQLALERFEYLGYHRVFYRGSNRSFIQRIRDWVWGRDDTARP